MSEDTEHPAPRKRANRLSGGFVICLSRRANSSAGILRNIFGMDDLVGISRDHPPPRFPLPFPARPITYR